MHTACQFNDGKRTSSEILEITATGLQSPGSLLGDSQVIQVRSLKNYRCVRDACVSRYFHRRSNTLGVGFRPHT